MEMEDQEIYEGLNDEAKEELSNGKGDDDEQ